jgi:adenine-specific DNA-methyltransferase
MPIEKLRPSFSFTEDRLRELQVVIPEAFADGKINWDVIREALGNNVVEGDEEYYGLIWPGKKEARRIANSPSKGTIVPQDEMGVFDESSPNIFIEGENLVVSLLGVFWIR